MTDHERIKILRQLKERPRTMINHRPDKVEEALNWAIEICQAFADKKEKEGVE